MTFNITIEHENEYFEINFRNEDLSNNFIGYLEKENEDYKIVISKEKNEIFKITYLGEKIFISKEDILSAFNNQYNTLEENKKNNDSDGVEEDESEFSEQNITDPYSPDDIRVEPFPFSIDKVYNMMHKQNGNDPRINLSPDFQRHFVWKDITRKSRLIESLLLRIPLPVFYMALDKKGFYQVVDGVQRLNVIKDFMSNKFKLKNLEYLNKLEGKYFRKLKKDNTIDEEISLPFSLISRIEDTILTFNVIDPQTPTKVKYDIFKRINTGGVPLNKQEIRNCISSPGIRTYLSKLSKSEEFLLATNYSINPNRMIDQELVLRFIAFFILKKDNVDLSKSPFLSLENLLDETIEKLYDFGEIHLKYIEEEFYNALRLANLCFGEYAFRKFAYEDNKLSHKSQINKSLFAAVTLSLTNYNYNDYDSKINKTDFLIKFHTALFKDIDFFNAITMGTSDKKRIFYSLTKTDEIIKNIMECYK